MPHFSRTLAVLLLLVQADAQAWWNPDWAYRKVITLDTTATGANIPNDLTDVPVLVRLHTGNFAHFLDLTEGGGDLRFVAGDDQTPLHHHLEKLDVVNELAFIWVKVPQLKGATAPTPSVAKDDPAAATGTNKIYAYFGNPKVLGAGASAATYGPNFALVYHFDELNGVPTDRSASALPPPTGSAALSVSARKAPDRLVVSVTRLSDGSMVSVWSSAVVEIGEFSSRKKPRVNAKVLDVPSER
jgi:biopolymer transport protein ExbB